ncbi:pyocin knob domain-containing protein [Levilactobacillus brevis]|uniref:pyocin knob domain-containing protein n=1 Tax=Levilactobacillus brevis TaxID=1580 RepID=UPI003F64012B
MADSTPSQYTIMTNAALALIKQLVDAKNRIKSFRAVASDANHFTDDQEAIAEMTAVDSVKQDGVIQDIQDDGDTKSYIQIDFDQSKIDTAYQLQTVGLFATDEKGKEILYAVECLEHPQYMDVSTTMDMNSHFIHIIVGNTQQLDVSLTPAGTVSVAQLESKLADYVKTDDVEKLIPSTVIDGSKPADFKEPVTLEKGAVDGTGTAIATAKDVSDGDATTLKSAKDYADTKVSGKADDSAVVHNTPTILPSGTDLNVVTSSGYYYIAGAINKPENADDWTIYQVVDLRSSLSNGVQIAYDTNENFQSMRTWSGKGWTPWKLLADDSKVVHLTDMRKPANQVASIDEVNAKQDKLDYTPANAANVVDRNPDTGVVSKPTDFTNLTVNGGKSVATRDDLKSLEASAWRELNFDVSQENYKAFSAAKIVYKINRDEKYISFFFAGTPSHVGNTSSNSTLVTDTTSLVMDLSSVLTEISGINFQTEYGQISDNNSHAASLGYAGAKVVFTSQVYISNILTGVTLLSKDYPDCRIYYTSLVNGI